MSFSICWKGCKMSTDDVSRRYAEVESLALAIERQLDADVERIGFADGEIVLLSAADAVYTLARDPANGDYSLLGEWRDERGSKTGSLAFHADGSFFVEHDIVRPHPSKPRWFVEAVTAWGKGEVIRSEPTLLAMPD